MDLYSNIIHQRLTVKDLEVRQHVKDVFAVCVAVTEWVAEVPHRVMEAEVL